MSDLYSEANEALDAYVQYMQYEGDEEVNEDSSTWRWMFWER